MTNNSITQTVRSLSTKFVALCCLLVVATWGYAQPPTPTISAEAVGANQTVLTRCGTGTLTFRVAAPATFNATDELALFTAGTYPPAETAITGAITQGWGYSFDVAGVLQFPAGATTAGMPALTTGSTNGPTIISARSNMLGDVSLNTNPVPIEGTTSLSMLANANGGTEKFVFSNFASGSQFYFRARLQVRATANFAANATQFSIYLGNNADPAFDVNNTNLPTITSSIFTPIHLNGNNAARTYFLSKTINGTAAASSYSSTLNALTGDDAGLPQSVTIEVYGNTGTTRYYYTRNGQVHYIDANRYDVWVDGSLSATNANQRGDDVTPPTAPNPATVNAILITNQVNNNTARLIVDDIRFISTITNAQDLGRVTCTNGSCTQAIVTPSTAASTSYVLASVRPSAAAVVGRGSTAGTTQAVTINAVPAAPTLTSPVNICGATAAATPVTFTVQLAGTANSVAFGNATRSSFDESGVAGTNIGSEGAVWTGTIAGSTVTASYAANGAANTGLQAGESTTLFAYAVQVSTAATVGGTNAAPVLNRIGASAFTQIQDLGTGVGIDAGVVYPGCVSPAVALVINANEIPAVPAVAAGAAANNFTTPIAPPFIGENGVAAADSKHKIARCGAGVATFTVDLNPAPVLGTTAQIPGVVELYTQATGGNPVSVSATITDLRNTTNVATIATPSVMTHTTYFMGFRRTDFTPGCTTAVARQAVEVGVIGVPSAPTVVATLHAVATNTCFTGTQQQIINVTATQGATAATHYRFFGTDNITEALAGSTPANALRNAAGTGRDAFTNILGGATPTGITVSPTLFPLVNSSNTGGQDFTPSEVRTYNVEGLNKITTPFISDIASGCSSATRNTWTVTASGPTPALPTLTVDNRCGNGDVTLTAVQPVGVTPLTMIFDADNNTGNGNLGTDATTPYNFTRNIAAATNTFAYYTTTNPLNTTHACTSAVSTVATATPHAVPALPTTVAIAPAGNCISTTLTFSGTGATAGTNVTIYTQSTGGTAIATGTAENYNNSVIGITVPFSANFASTQTFYVESASITTPVCTSATRLASTALTSSVAAPSAITIRSQPCGQGILRITGTAPVGSSVRLFTVSSGGTAIATVTQVQFSDINIGISAAVNITAPATYYLEAFAGPCASTRTAAPVTLANVPPIAPTATAITQCVSTAVFATPGSTSAVGANIFSITPTVSGTVTRVEVLRDNSQNAAVLGFLNQSVAPFTFTFGTSATANDPLNFTDGVAKTFYLRSINLGCTSSISSVTVTLNRTPDVPAAALAPNTTTLCGSGTVTFTFNLTNANSQINNGFRLYTVATGGTAISTLTVAAVPSMPSLTTTVTTTTSYWFTQFNPTNNCESARQAMLGPITIANTLAAPTVPNISFCGNSQVTFTATGMYPNDATVNIYTVSTGGTALAGGGNPITFAGPGGNIQTIDANSATDEVRMTTAMLTTTTTYWVDVMTLAGTQGACTSARTQVIATQQTAPIAPTANNITICRSTTNGARITMTVSGAIPNPGGVKLYANNTTPGDGSLSAAAPLVGGNVDNTPPYEFSFDATTATAAATTYYLGAFSATSTLPGALPGCETTPSSRTMVTVMINALPGDLALGTAPNNVRSNLSCDNSNNTIIVPVNAGTGAINGNIIRLYNVATGGTSISSTSQVTNGNFLVPVTTPLTNSTSYYLTQVDPITGCESANRLALGVNINATPTAPTVNPVSRCGSGHVTFTVNSSTPGVAVVLYSNATVTAAENSVVDNTFPFELPTSNMTGVNVSSSLAGAATAITVTTTYYITTRIGQGTAACESARVPVVVTINSLPSAPLLTETPRRCGSGQVTLMVDGSTVAANSEVRLYTRVVANDAVSLSQTTPAQLGTALATDNSPPYELVTPGINASTSFHLVAVNSVTGCESIRSTITANYSSVPSLPFANDITRCGVGSAIFTGVTRGVVTSADDVIRLYTVAMGGTPVATVGPALGAQTEVVSPTITTTTTFYLAVYNSLNNSVNSNTCEGPRKMVLATVNPGPSNPMVADVARCSTGTVVFSPFFGAVPGTEVRLWNSAAAVGAGNLLATVSTALGANSMITITSPSVAITTTFWVEVANPGVTTCNSERVAVKATVNENPASPTLASTFIQSCGPGNVQVSSNLTLPVNELRVYTQSVGGNFIANDIRITAPWIVTVPVATTSNFFVTAYNSSTGCESANRTQVNVVVNSQTRPSPPMVSATSVNLLCGQGSATINAMMGNVPGTSIRIYTLPVGGTSTQEITASPFQFNISPTQTTTYYLASYNSNTTCESERISYVVNVGGNLAVPQVTTSSLARCGEGVATFTANFSQVNTGDQIRLYTQQTGGDAISSISPTRTVSGSQFLITTPAIQTSTTFYISAFESTTGCESSQRTTLALTVNPLPERPTSSNVGRCSLGAVTFTVTMGAPAGTEARLYTVEMGGAPIVTDGAAPYELTTGNLGNGTVNYFISALSNTTDSDGNRCESPRLAVQAVVTQGVNTPSLTSNTIVGCGSGSSAMMFALGNPTATLISGSGIRLYTLATGGTAVATSSSAPYMLMTPTINASTTFYASAFDPISGCESSRIMAMATVANSAPTTPMASDIISCVAGTGSATFTVMPGNIYGAEARLYTQPTGGSAIQTTATMPYTFTVNNLSASTTYYVAIGTGTTCESLRRMVMATINGTPSAPTVSNATRCGAGVVNFNVMMGAIAGSRVVLYDAPMGGNVLSVSNNAPYSLSANITTATNFWVAVETDNCSSERTQVTGSLSDQSPIHGFASTNIAVCPGSRGTFIANLNGFGNELRMYNTSVGGNLIAVANAIINNTTPFPLRTPVLNNTTQFFVSAYDANSSCETSRIPVTATVGNPSAPQVATATITRCGPGSVAFEAFLTQPTGSELRLYSQAAGGAPLATDDSSPYMVSTPMLTAPRTMFYVSVGAGTCESDRVAVIANVQAGPSTATASDVSRCGVGQVTFTVNMGGVPGSYVRLYDAEVGGNIIDQSNSFPYLLTTSFLSTNTNFYVAVGNSSCETSRILVRAMVGSQPGAPVPVASTIGLCGTGSIAFLLNQNANNPGNAIRLYAGPQGGMPLSMATAPQPNTLGYEVRTPVISGTTSFFAAAVSGGCESDRVQLTAISTPAPSQPSANNVTRCGVGAVMFTAGQGSIAGSEIRLYVSPTAAMPIAVATAAPFEVATPPLTTTQTFFITAASGACESIRVPVTAIIGSTLAAPSANNVSICGGGSPIFTAISNPGSGVELRLYTVPMGGTPIATTDRAPFTLAAPAINTSTTYYLASGTGNVCESNRTQVVATVLLGSAPTAPMAESITRCGAGSVVITAFMTSNPGQSMRLWTAQTGGSLVAETFQGPSYLLNINQVNAPVVYFVSAASGQCESARIPVQVNVVAQVPTPTVNSVSICGGQASSVVFSPSFGAVNGVEARLYTIPFGGMPVAVDPGAPYTLSSPMISFTSTFYVSGVLGSCEGVRVPVTASIAQAPSNPMAANVAICGTNTGVISANFGSIPGSEIRLYTQAVGGQPINAATAFPYNLTVTNVVTQTTYYISSALLGNCESGRTPVVVSLASNPMVTPTVTSETCGALGSINVSVSPAGVYNYLLNGNVPGAPNANGSVDFTNLTSGTYSISVTSAGGCRSDITATIGLASAPSTVMVSNINATTASVMWAPIQGALSYRLEYRVAGSNASFMGMDLLGTVTSQTLNALQVGTTYEVRVNALCSNRRTTAFASTTFTTLAQSGSGNCSTPTNVTAAGTGPSRATINWTPNLSGAVCYIVSYGPADNPENTWNQFLVQHPSNSIQIDAQPGIRYGVRLRTNCTTCGLRTGTITPASEVTFFTVGAPKLGNAVTSGSMDVSVYPNPNNGHFNIGFNATEAGNVAVQVVDLNGRVVYTNAFEAVEGQNEFTVALDQISAGIYFVNFRQGTNVAKIKIGVN